MNQEDKTFTELKFLRRIINFMREESIISKVRAERLKKDVQKWWFIKTQQSDKLRSTKIKW